MGSPRRTRLLGAFLLVLLAGLVACRAGRSGGASAPLVQPGWGRIQVPESEHMTVRAVPASARPSLPSTPLVAPGWGRARGIR